MMSTTHRLLLSGRAKPSHSPQGVATLRARDSRARPSSANKLVSRSAAFTYAAWSEVLSRTTLRSAVTAGLLSTSALGCMPGTKAARASASAMPPRDRQRLHPTHHWSRQWMEEGGDREDGLQA